MFFCEQLVLVEVGLELAEFNFEVFDLVEVLFVELLVGGEFIGLLLAEVPLAVEFLSQIVDCDGVSLQL